MKKAALLQEIIDLKQEIEYLKEENSDSKRQADEIKQLKKENEELKRSNTTLKHQIDTMSDAKRLLDDNLKTHRAREKIVRNHNSVLDAFYQVNKGYKRLMMDFIPQLEKLQDDVRTLSDEFLIPIDSEVFPDFLDGKDERVKAYEERKKALFDYQMAQIERRPSAEIEEARNNLMRLIDKAENAA